MNKTITIICLIFLVLGCASMPKPTPEQLSSANYGPFPQNWKQIVTDALAVEMIRPETLNVQKTEEPVKTWIITPDGETLYAWGVCGFNIVEVSSLRPFSILIRDGKTIFKALDYDVMKRVPGKTWMRNGINTHAYDYCPNLFKH